MDKGKKGGRKDIVMLYECAGGKRRKRRMVGDRGGGGRQCCHGGLFRCRHGSTAMTVPKPWPPSGQKTLLPMIVENLICFKTNQVREVCLLFGFFLSRLGSFWLRKSGNTAGRGGGRALDSIAEASDTTSFFLYFFRKIRMFFFLVGCVGMLSSLIFPVSSQPEMLPNHQWWHATWKANWNIYGTRCMHIFGRLVPISC